MIEITKRRVVALTASLLLSHLALGCAPTLQTSSATPSVTASANTAAPVRSWKHGAMISAANPLAVEAGLTVLRKGGSAVDAAIAVQTALGLVEPQSSGIGGGAFMIYFDAASGKIEAYQGRETAPLKATAELFLGNDGKPLPFVAAMKSGRSTGVPGAIAMLALAHEDHGRLPWKESFQPAISLASEGFKVSPRLTESIGFVMAFAPFGENAPETAAYLLTPDGKPIPPGTLLKNAAYADTLSRIANEGPRAFYEGPIAQSIVDAVARPPLAGTLSLEDLKNYKAERVTPICRPYRVYKACGVPPPSSGGVAILATLGILENIDMANTGPNTAQGWHYLADALRLAYADRDLYVGDDRFVKVPIEGMLNGEYLKSRASQIKPDAAISNVTAGTPPGAPVRGKDATGEVPGTTHFVVVDNRGNVVSMTTTVEGIFGSSRMASGFILNNQLTDFSFKPVDDKGQPVANAAAPGKRPRSSMSPTLVFDKDGAFVLAVGSPGGNAIISYVAKALVGMLDWKLTPQQAVDLPNVVARGPLVIENARMNPAITADLKARGFPINENGRGGEGSGLHAVMVTPNGLRGAADSRREGLAKAP